MEYSLPLGELLAAIAIDVSGETASHAVIKDISVDSRKVAAGTLFCAYPGERADGRNYIEQALQAGAAAVLCEAEGFEPKETDGIRIFPVAGLQHKIGILAHYFFGQPSEGLQVFGVTGTNGKTTCCHLITQALSRLGMQVVMMGTVGIGKLDELVYSPLTTPDPVSIHRQLATWRDQGITQVCMEVSSHALDQGRVAGIKFFCALFTNLSHDHLDYHGDMAQYAAAKLRLFTDYPSELVITNMDDDLGASLIDLANSNFIASYGDGGDVSISETQLSVDGMALTVSANDMEFDIQTRLVGRVNAPNILLLVCTLLSLGYAVAEIQDIVVELVPAPGRMELFSNNTQARVVVDFAHTPDALEKALLSVREHCAGELWCVFGCGGDRDKGKRAVMGAVAARHADRIVVTNDNPRSESPDAIAKDILSAIKCDVLVELDRATAISTAIKQALPDDWVLVAGKGHEQTQQIGDQFRSFSDRHYVAELLGVAA